MPVYNEIPHVLMHAIDSAVESDYPTSCIHLFVSFDGDAISELYLKTLENLGVPVPMQEYPVSLDLTYRGARVTVSRFPHGGKRHCQKKSFKLMDKIYADYLHKRDDLFVLFIDSDIILDTLTIQNFMYDMELKPGSRKDMLAMTGVITCTTEKQSLITLLQDVEYIHGQLFERSVESVCGSVTCLPGALTCLRFSGFRRMAKYYFADKAEQCEDLFDFGKCHLGEDRWLTHLFMIGAKRPYQIQMCSGAFCKTEAVVEFKSLLKQRRRWFIGFITNEVCMLTDPRLWKRYPILCLLRFMQDTIRTTALLFFIIVLSLITTVQSAAQVPVGFIAVSLGLNWALMLYFGIRLRRLKAWLYPLMFILNPFFNWLYMVYGIFTAGQRTWGGPRADAGGDDEVKEDKPGHAGGAEVHEGFDADGQPLEIEDVGQFNQPKNPIGLFPPEMNQSTDSLGSYFPSRRVENPVSLHPRASFESYTTMGSMGIGGSSVNLPQRLDHLQQSNAMEKSVYGHPRNDNSPYGYADYDQEALNRQFPKARGGDSGDYYGVPIQEPEPASHAPEREIYHHQPQDRDPFQSRSGRSTPRQSGESDRESLHRSNIYNGSERPLMLVQQQRQESGSHSPSRSISLRNQTGSRSPLRVVSREAHNTDDYDDENEDDHHERSNMI